VISKIESYIAFHMFKDKNKNDFMRDIKYTAHCDYIRLIDAK